VILKIGTSVLLDSAQRISMSKVESFARQIRSIKEMSVDVIVVSSGAIACGMEAMQLSKKPRDMARKQALASIGQIVLMKMYMDAFAKVGLKASQVLLTHEHRDHVAGVEVFARRHGVPVFATGGTLRAAGLSSRVLDSRTVRSGQTKRVGTLDITIPGGEAPAKYCAAGDRASGSIFRSSRWS
jgi:glyoxylase-like metal-dependent hydrolase (beta-lactamase superfamily II)